MALPLLPAAAVVALVTVAVVYADATRRDRRYPQGRALATGAAVLLATLAARGYLRYRTYYSTGGPPPFVDSTTDLRLTALSVGVAVALAVAGGHLVRGE